MLDNGSQVRLTVNNTNFDFLLDPTVEKPYRRGYEPFFANTFQTAGSGRENVRRELILPDFSDWSGGQENRYFNPADPIVYDHGLCNPRIPGELRGEPAQTDATVLTPTVVPSGFFANAEGFMWGVCSRSAATSTDLLSWTNRTTGITGTNKRIYGVASDGNTVYLAWSDTVTPLRNVMEVTTTSQTALVTNDQANNKPWTGCAYLGPYLYVLASGGSMYRVDTTGSTPTNWSDNGNPLYSIGVAIDAGFGDIVTGDTSVFMFHAQVGKTQVHEYTAGSNGTGRPVWELPMGFTGRAIGYANGWLYLAGVYNNKAALFRMNNEDRERELVDFIGRSAGASYTPVAISAGPGAQVLIGMLTGEVFVYDGEADSISQLGVRTGAGNLDAVGAYSQFRVAGYLDTTNTKFESRAWDFDDAATTSSASCVMPATDLNLAEIRKFLMGYSITYRPVGSSTATIKYMLDESGDSATDANYTALSAIDTSDSSGRTYTAVSSQGSGNTKKFYQLRTKLSTTNGARITSIVPFVKLAERQNVWDVYVVVTDEHVSLRPSDRQDMGQDIAADLNTAPTGIIPSEVVATFTNGCEDPRPGQTTSHTVWIEVAEFDVANPGDSRTGQGLRATAHLRLWDLVP